MRAAILLTSVMALAACHVSGHARDDEDHGPRGPAVKRNYQVGVFDHIKLTGSHDVIVTVGPAVSVSAEGDSASLDRLEIRVDGDTLRVGSKRNGKWFDVDHGSHIVVRVTVPKLAGGSIEGSGDMRIDKAEGDSFRGAIGGSGDLEIGTMRVASADFSIAGSGSVRASGNADSVSMSIAGSGDVDAGGLQVKTAKISVMGSGDVRAHATETADVSVMGSGDVTVDGPARCTTNKMGSGDVRCGG
jgi:hypothetical protein